MDLNEMYTMLSAYRPAPVEALPDYLDKGFSYPTVRNEDGLIVFPSMPSNSITHWITTPEGRLTIYQPQAGAWQYKFGRQCCTPLHRHESIELGYVVKGQIRQIFSGVEYLFPEGSFWLSDCSSCHQDVIGREELQTVFFGFNTAAFNRNFLQKLDGTSADAFFQTALVHQKKIRRYIMFTPPGDEPPKARALVEQMAREYAERETGFDLIVMGLLSRLLSILFGQYHAQYIGQDADDSSSLLYVKILAYLDGRYADVNLKELAEHFHYSTDFISRVIKRGSGLSYASFIQKLRMDKAAQLLCSTQLSVEKVMEQVGYQNRKFFSDLFVRYKGMPPSDYRKLV